ncbi:MAG TPA: hypothetical protein VKA15_25605, partial [Isosphaeraceae bacterium]|nr:hypothetical protein [Isosphaeraceae bacterium]
GKRVRRMRKTTALTVSAEAHRIRNAMLEKQNMNPLHVEAQKLVAMAEKAHPTQTPGSPGEATVSKKAE